MCHQVQCKICAKPTWAGCGLHIEHALAGVPVAKRCRGHSDAEIAAYRAEHSVWRRLLRRK